MSLWLPGDEQAVAVNGLLPAHHPQVTWPVTPLAFVPDLSSDLLQLGEGVVLRLQMVTFRNPGSCPNCSAGGTPGPEDLPKADITYDRLPTELQLCLRTF